MQYTKQQLSAMSYKVLGQVGKALNINWVGVRKVQLIDLIDKAQRLANEVPTEVASLQPGMYEAEVVKVHVADDLVDTTLHVEQTDTDVSVHTDIIPDEQPIGNKKVMIEQLLREGISKAEIARKLHTHYSYVHAVAKQFEQSDGFKYKSPMVHNSIAQQIRDLADQGLTKAQICQQLQVDYSRVYTTLKKKEVQK